MRHTSDTFSMITENGSTNHTYTANGDNADYEWRIYFNCLYQDVSQSSTLISAVSAKRIDNNNVNFDTQGGTLNNTTNGTLTTTNWGNTRTSSVAVPTRDGYTFTGWYAYKTGTNNGADVTFSGDLVQIWDADGNLCSDATIEKSLMHGIKKNYRELSP